MIIIGLFYSIWISFLIFTHYKLVWTVWGVCFSFPCKEEKKEGKKKEKKIKEFLRISCLVFKLGFLDYENPFACDLSIACKEQKVEEQYVY